MKIDPGETRGTQLWRLLAGASALMLALSGCGTQSGAEIPPESLPTDANLVPAPPDYVVSLPPDVASIVDEIRLSYDRWAGGIESRQAAAVVQAYADNAGTDECVEEAGYALYPGWRIAIQPISYRPWYSSNIGLAPPVRTVTYYASVNVGAARLEPWLHKAPEPAVDEVLNECLRSHTHRGELIGPLSDEELEAMLYPQVVSNLEEDWATAMEKAAADSGISSDEVWACFTASDPGAPFTGSDPGDFAENWWQTVIDELPDSAHVPNVGETSDDPKWRATRQAEGALTTALWECHDDAYGKALTVVEEAATRFDRDHAAEIADAEAGWRRVRETASTMGWSLDRPVAGLDLEAQ